MDKNAEIKVLKWEMNFRAIEKNSCNNCKFSSSVDEVCRYNINPEFQFNITNPRDFICNYHTKKENY